MDRPEVSKGFTLVELMITSTILIVLTTQFAVALISCFKLYHAAMAQSELSIRARELREKLLFHVRPPDADKSYSGLMSGRNLQLNASKLRMMDETIPLDGLTLKREDFQDVKLALSDDEDSGKIQLKDEEAPDDIAHLRWLCPGGLSLGSDTAADVVFDDRFLDDDHRMILTLTLAAESKAGMDFGSRTERIVLPMFNAVQKNVNLINDIEPLGEVAP